MMLTVPSDPRSAKAAGAIASPEIAPSNKALVFIFHSLLDTSVSLFSRFPSGKRRYRVCGKPLPTLGICVPMFGVAQFVPPEYAAIETEFEKKASLA
tara:strand:- start:428 stop:718 length:291 start_codon:yes stop_codon:yes gene_type:complete